MFSIAVPVRDPQDRVLAGLACQAPLMRVAIEQAEEILLPALQDAAGRMQDLIADDFEINS